MGPLRLFGLIFLTVWSQITFSHEFAPENNLKIGPEVISFNGIDETAFNEIISSVEQVYAPIISQMGGRLYVDKNWNDANVNAYAERNGNIWIVKMLGGLARHGAITRDGFATVICHEIGHHIGGAPKMTEIRGQWASVEGESDYFASLKCLRKVWRNDDNIRVIQNMSVDPEADRLCKLTYTDPARAALCIRSVMAAVSTANLLADISNSTRPSTASTDNSRVSKTVETHPKPQCRLDTYLNGALCTVSEDIDVNQSNANIGVCTDRKNYGARPLCWYADSGAGGGGGSGGNIKVATPLLNGQTTYSTSNANEMVQYSFDITNVPSADYIYIEISKPNTPFQNPNDTKPDPNRLDGRTFKGRRGSGPIYTSGLPSRGTYYLRVIPVSSQTRDAAAPASDAATLNFK